MMWGSRKRVLPGFGLSLGSSLFYTCLILLLPLSALVMQLSSITWAQYWQVIAQPAGGCRLSGDIAGSNGCQFV